IASPPIIVGTIISVGWTMLRHELFSVGSPNDPTEMVFYYIFTWFGGIVIWLTETIATLTVMGGASRNFVRHLLFGEPITFRETYQNVRERLGGLIITSIIITLLIAIIGTFIFYFGIVLATIVVMITIAAFSFSPFLTFIVSLMLGLVIFFAAGWLFFLAVSRFAYVPQVMLVENQGIFAAIGRSTGLADGNVKRLAALFVFSTVATYSALALLYIPLGWYAYLNGVEILAFDADAVPAWYEIANQLVWQLSFILLTPVWMIGLCLLYVDERVRHEGYDIELMAARQLGEIPAVLSQFVNPLQPALATPNLQNPKRKKDSSILGLN
ncbi:MAG: hypothetical protein LC768_17475, partial [Acidobacteria bacterium]|nr:hypothetical protein [Acidobacteriota bacterium]MCA1640084.1 hypothetical protein [Acidobacteriota bacterium]